jgi:hypothetical protein
MESHVRSPTFLAMTLAAALASEPAAAQQAMTYNEPEMIGRLLPSVVSIVSTMPGSTQGGVAVATGSHTERGGRAL